MGITRHHRQPEIHRVAQLKYIDIVRWLPSQSAFDRHAALAVFNADTSTPSLQLQSYTPNSNSTLTHQFTYTPPSRITSLRPSSSFTQTQTHHKPFIVLATITGCIQVLSLTLTDDGMNSTTATIQAVLESEENVHLGEVKCVDVLGDECVSVGDDGRLCLFKFAASASAVESVFESNGLVEYNAVKWASGCEFVTGGFGFGLQWWDRRKPGGPASQLNGNWANRKDSGIVHSIDIHPSRKHTCVAGGSAGNIFAWDLRWQQQPIVLSGIGMGEGAIQSPSESEVWEVQYDHYTKSSNISSVSSSRILPVMFCSEDGILGVLEQGAEPVELLAEPCAINSLDIDRQNPSDVICSLEWESVAILARP